MKNILFTLFMLNILLQGLLSCSRTDPIKENAALSNFMVSLLVLDKCPTNLEAFTDSLNAKDSIVTKDTTVVTINDSLYLMGYFRGKPNVAGYELGFGKAGLLKFEQMAPMQCKGIAIADSGLYSILYRVVGVDKGIRTSDSSQAIRIIDTKPTLEFALDSITSSKNAITSLGIHYADSLGRVDSIKIDWDFDGISDTSFLAPPDSAFIAIHYDSSRVDSLGNQQIIISVVDEDGNMVSDTVFIHFNRPPMLYLHYPIQNGMHHIYFPFQFSWEAIDLDNRDSVFFSLRVSTSPKPSKDDIIEDWFREDRWRAIQEDSTILLPDTLRGRLYWQVMAHDGYDTVLSAVHNFYLGDLANTTGSASGYALMQTLNDHRGLRVTLKSLQGQYQYSRSTAADGSYLFENIEVGSYEVIVQDTMGFGWPIGGIDSIYASIGILTTLDTIILIDTIAPVAFSSVAYDSLITTLDPRSLTFEGLFRDSGSQVLPDSVRFETQSGLLLHLTQATRLNWNVTIENIQDGQHKLVVIPYDKAGNWGDSLFIPYVVKAKKLNVSLEEGQTAIVKINEPISFKAVVSNALPSISHFEWYAYGNKGELLLDADTITAFQDTSAFTFQWNQPVAQGRIVVYGFDQNYIENPVSKQDSIQNSLSIIKDTLSFIIQDGSTPSVLIVRPSGDTTVTINDSIALHVITSDPDDPSGSTLQVTWDLDGDAIYDDDTGDSSGIKIATPGDYWVRVRVVDGDGYENFDSVLIRVELGEPWVQVKSTVSQVKINDPLALGATGGDNMGQIQTWEWSCGTAGSAGTVGTWFTVSGTPGAATDTTINAPSTAANPYYCIVRVTDNDNLTAQDTLSWTVLQGLPSVTVSKNRDTVGINDAFSVDAVAEDALGVIESIEWKCGDGAWVNTGSTQADFTAPPTPANPYYCIVRATDDDGQSARDTVRLVVELRPPTVVVLNDSQVVSIGDAISLRMQSSDPVFPGTIVSEAWSCGVGSQAGVTWVTVSGDTTWTAPNTAVPNYGFKCIARATDDDGLVAMDTLHINVGSFPPTVTMTKPVDSVSIFDQVLLQAVATDELGFIVLYEWSCNGEAFSAATASYSWQAPADSISQVECIVKVTDDDGNTALDSGYFDVVLDFPSVQFSDDSLQATTNDEVVLTATGADAFGTIAKYEWDCGGAGAVGINNWVSTGTAGQRTVTMPGTGTGGYDYLCVVRVTDDDGLTARDTVWFKVQDVNLVVTITEEVSYMRVNTQHRFEATASVDVGDVDSYEWGCNERGVDVEDWYIIGQTAAGSPWYYYDAPSTSNMNLYCAVRVTSGGNIAYDTVLIYVYTPPDAIVTAPESLFVWSGNLGLGSLDNNPDADINRMYISFHQFVHGAFSTPGTWGDGSIDRYEWRFIRGTEKPQDGDFVNGYVGNDDGTLFYYEFTNRDTTLRENDDISKVYIKLDVYDSLMGLNPDPVTLGRHIDITIDSITFYRAWERIGTAPLQNEGKVDAAEIAATALGIPVIAYSIEDSVYVRRYTGVTWEKLGSFYMNSGHTFGLATQGEDIWIAYSRTGTTIQKYSGGSWEAVGSTIAGQSNPVLKIFESTVYLLTSNSSAQPYLYTWGGATWESIGRIQDEGINAGRDLNFSPNGNYLVAAWRNTSGSVRYRVYNSNTQAWDNATQTAVTGLFPSASISNSKQVYIATINNWLPKVYQCLGGCSQIGANITLGSEGYYNANTSIETDAAGNVYFAFEQGLNATSRYTTVWKYDATASEWQLFGEDFLPYFNKTYGANYVRSHDPDLVLTNGRVYVGFRILESGGGTQYNGAMVMRHRLPGQ
jgi:hypothetical protein